jgi:hypothetical protein
MRHSQQGREVRLRQCSARFESLPLNPDLLPCTGGTGSLSGEAPKSTKSSSVRALGVYLTFATPCCN